MDPRAGNALILAYVAHGDGITGSDSREANKNKKGRPDLIGTPLKTTAAPFSRNGKKLEREPQAQTNGSASLISIRLAIRAANCKRAASAACRWTGRARWRRVHQSHVVIRMKCRGIERSAIAGNEAAWRDEVRAEAAGDIPFDVSH